LFINNISLSFKDETSVKVKLLKNTQFDNFNFEKFKTNKNFNILQTTEQNLQNLFMCSTVFCQKKTAHNRNHLQLMLPLTDERTKTSKLDFRAKLIKTFPKANEQQTRETEERKNPPLKHMLKATNEKKKR
jgi:hypothetical protein